jgi:ribonuclease-3
MLCRTCRAGVAVVSGCGRIAYASPIRSLQPFADAVVHPAMLSPQQMMELCEKRIGYKFRDQVLLRRCLTHSSAAETRLNSNERLEFLGDAVLGVVIVEQLFHAFPGEREGRLTQMKSWLVSRQTCARVARSLGLEELILVGRGLQSMPDSVLSAAVESIVGGVYLDGGFEIARGFILRVFHDDLAACRPVELENFKSQLQEYTQREMGQTPEYVVVEERGPDHAREFRVAARVGETTFETGRGRSKKEAGQQAARNAVQTLQGNVPGPSADPMTTEFGAGCDVLPEESHPASSRTVTRPAATAVDRRES